MREVRLNSILDNDFYKITMQNAVVKLFTNEIVKYEFINRGKHSFPEGFAEELRKSVNAMAELKLTKDEKNILKSPARIWLCPILTFWKVSITILRKLKLSRTAPISKFL